MARKSAPCVHDQCRSAFVWMRWAHRDAQRSSPVLLMHLRRVGQASYQTAPQPPQSSVPYLPCATATSSSPPLSPTLKRRLHRLFCLRLRVRVAAAPVATQSPALPPSPPYASRTYIYGAAASSSPPPSPHLQRRCSLVHLRLRQSVASGPVAVKSPSRAAEAAAERSRRLASRVPMRRCLCCHRHLFSGSVAVSYHPASVSDSASAPRPSLRNDLPHRPRRCTSRCLNSSLAPSFPSVFARSPRRITRIFSTVTDSR